MLPWFVVVRVVRLPLLVVKSLHNDWTSVSSVVAWSVRASVCMCAS